MSVQITLPDGTTVKADSVTVVQDEVAATLPGSELRRALDSLGLTTVRWETEQVLTRNFRVLLVGSLTAEACRGRIRVIEDELAKTEARRRQGIRDGWGYEQVRLVSSVYLRFLEELDQVEARLKAIEGVSHDQDRGAGGPRAGGGDGAALPVVAGNGDVP